MDKIVLYEKEDEASAYDEAKNDMNLRDVFGVKGTLEKDKATAITLYYDFLPCNIHDPILLT